MNYRLAWVDMPIRANEFPALTRRLSLLQQELYETSKVLDINRHVPDTTGDLTRYQMASDALSKEIDELTWVLAHIDGLTRIPISQNVFAAAVITWLIISSLYMILVR